MNNSSRLPWIGVHFCLALVGLLVTQHALLQASNWRTEVVDAGGGGKFSTLLFDSFGNAHVSYTDMDVHHLRYAFWDRSLGKWYKMTVDPEGHAFSSMALDSKQHPHIAYVGYGGILKYARWDGVAWKIERIRINAQVIAYYTSILVDLEDRPIITFYEEVGPPPVEGWKLTLRCAKWSGKVWEISTIDSTRGSGKFNSIVKGPTGEFHAAWANVRTEVASLRYASWSGAAWKAEVLEGRLEPFYVYSVALAVDKSNVPHIAYTDITRHQIKYATRRGTAWDLQVVDTVAREGYPDRNGITVDDQGKPYISYYDEERGILKLAHREGERWIREDVDSSFSGFTSSIQIRNGEIVITYYDSVTNSLKCARGAVGPTAGSPIAATSLSASRPGRQ